ncbi:MAG: restriction endonuclease, partial [Candidatus Obscuribacterales bacterium]|nr:restriction endonuclease [Candidatus Obscuribacterales bacterium]
METNQLPFASEFSPSQIDLITLLEIAKTHSGDGKAIKEAILKRYFGGKKDRSAQNNGKLAGNARLAMQKYGVLGEDFALTVLGEQLLSLCADEKAMYAELAKHILLNLNGLALVTCLKDMEAAGEKVDGTKLRHWLEERGVLFPRGGKHPNIMRLWLEKAGIFAGSWRVNEARLQEVLGVSEDDVEALLGLSGEQGAFLKALANIGESDTAFPSNQIEKLASATYGIKFNEKALPQTVLYPLEAAGFITLERGTKAGGRGAKPFLVTATEKFTNEILVPLLEQSEKLTNADLRPFLRKPLDEILAELNHKDKHVKGLALEALAIKIMRLIDLDYVKTRLRGTKTGGAEVDVIFESSRLIFSRWQVQCKNTASVSLDDVAKEVGLTHLLKSNVIVIMSTGEIGGDARQYADTIMRDSNLCIAMINQDRKST